MKSGLYVGDALFSGFTGKFVNTSGRDDAVGDASLTQICQSEGTVNKVEDETCGWVVVDPAKYEYLGYVSIVGSAKRPLAVEGYELKLGAYTLYSQYKISHHPDWSPDKEDDQTWQYFDQIELMDTSSSGAFTALAAGATMLMAALAF